MAVTPVMSRTAALGDATTNAGSGTSAADLMNNFMTLLVAQMQNQDPTNPMDNNQMTSQLAQFNTASGVEQLNDTLNNVGTLVSSMQQMNAAAWVGRKVMIAGAPVVDGSGGSVAFSLENDADQVEVTLTDKEGNAWRATLHNVKAGIHHFSLDELGDFQPAAPPADTTYSVAFTAADENGDAPTIVALKAATVDSVAFSPTGSVLQLGVDGSATLSQVYEID